MVLRTRQPSAACWRRSSLVITVGLCGLLLTALLWVSKPPSGHVGGDARRRLDDAELALIGILEEVRAYPGFTGDMTRIVQQLYNARLLQHSSDLAVLSRDTLQHKHDLSLTTEELDTLQRWSRIAQLKVQAIHNVDLCPCTHTTCPPSQASKIVAQQGNVNDVQPEPEKNKKQGEAAPEDKANEAGRNEKDKKDKTTLRPEQQQQQQQQQQQKSQQQQQQQQQQQVPDADVTDVAHRGMANAHYWFNVCGSKISILKNHPNFPARANHLDALTRLDHVVRSASFGTRVFGFIIPPRDGTYVFAVSGDDQIELRLSADRDLAHAELIASAYRPTPRNKFDVLATQKSKPLSLRGNTPYAFEVLHKQGESTDHMQVAWSLDGGPFNIIQGDALALFDMKHTHEDNYLDEMQLVKEAEESPHSYHLGNIQRIPYVSDGDTDGALPACEYSPSWVHKRKLRRYEAAETHLVRTSLLYPTYDARMPRGEGTPPSGDRDPQPKLSDVEANALAQKFMTKLNAHRSASNKPTFRLHRIHQIEAKKALSPRDGIRYLVEVDVVSDDQPEPRRVSRYVVQTYRNELCYPEGWTWKKDATVYIVIPVKNQAPWVIHLIKNMQRLLAVMHDARITLVIVDFGSTDANIKQLLDISGIDFVYVPQESSFSRALGVQKGIDAVKDPDAVVFACDLHLEITPAVIENCRKHSVRNHLGYVPVVIRLGCGAHPGDVSGFWEVPGYGLFAMTKADWVAIGGMNTREYKDKWGGEDWEMLDRVFEHGYDADRIKEHQFYHYYHTRAGMWNSNLNINLPTNVKKA